MSADTETAAPSLAELRDLKMTVSALREELEASRRAVADAVRQGVSGANAEIAQLKAAIGALRDELQEWPIRRDEAARLAQGSQSGRDQAAQVRHRRSARYA
jgi:HAMP domain-containing protein